MKIADTIMGLKPKKRKHVALFVDTSRQHVDMAEIVTERLINGGHVVCLFPFGDLIQQDAIEGQATRRDESEQCLHHLRELATRCSIHIAGCGGSSPNAESALKARHIDLGILFSKHQNLDPRMQSYFFGAQGRDLLYVDLDERRPTLTSQISSERAPVTPRVPKGVPLGKGSTIAQRVADVIVQGVDRIARI